MIRILNAELEKLLAMRDPIILWEAMRYSVFAGGKRLRPQLLAGACLGLGGSIEEALPFACAVEMIHTYSLIHDDLPAMDDDDLRRGMPTSHKMFGQGMAILAGDGLLNLAYETMLAACGSMGDKMGRGVKAASILAKAAGSSGMVAGQSVDILSENKKIDERTLLYMHANKTSALISASLEAGGILAGCGASCARSLKEAGEKLGLAFQIRDDLLDITETTENLGKPANSDLKSNKSTYVSLFGIERAKADYERLSLEAEEALGGLDWKDGFLLGLARKMHKGVPQKAE
ncbi:MAG: polyprenyl synthetase family protein [Clostridiales bacterium]|jgi:geranylgeranyl diphosphate synthase type II|nr:polyprenyl synthetase family protein [Clostridiales bacterium]